MKNETNANMKNGQTALDRRAEIYDQVWEHYNRILLSNMENGVIHNPLNQELREYEAVKHGDVEELRKVIEEDYEDRNGLLSTDPVRQAIDIGIVIVTRSRMAAASGGVSPEACFCLSDATIQAMEACRDPSVILYIARTSEERYAMMVREALADKESDSRKPEENSRHISRCKDYIFHHLTQRMTVRQIADAIGLEPNYLSTLFHKCEHIPLKQFILREKIQLAKNMLAYSPYSYIEIANYLGFSSQSHLGEQFRRFTGMTLRQYRERHAKEDFLQELVEKELS